MLLHANFFQLLAISLLSPIGVAYAHINRKSTPISAAYIPGAYIVEFEDDVAAPELFLSTLLSNHNLTANLRLKLQHALFNGASFQVAPWHDYQASVERIQNMSQVKNTWPVRLFSLPETLMSNTFDTGDAKPSTFAASEKKEANYADSDEDTYAPHVMGGVNKLRNKGYDGTSIFVAMIDTGVDYNHPDLGGGFGPGFKVAKGYDLVGDDYNGLNTPIPDADPMDCYGHGTHVSGIIGANTNQYNFTGVAPNATLGMWRVFGCTGSATEDVLISAFNMAYEAGADIITASIGQSSGWTEDAWDVVAQRIVKAGVPTVISAGNDGANGLFDTSAAAEAIGVNAIGSIDNIITPKLLPLATYQTDGSSPVEFSYNPSPANGDFGTIRVPLYALDLTGANLQDACSELPPTTPDLSGYVLLIRRGTCSFDIKINNARAFGAQRFIFYNNIPGPASTPGVTITDIPAAMVTPEQGIAWLTSLSENILVFLAFTAAAQSKTIYSVASNSVTGGFMSPFSSWGPTFETYVKPQISAPGANILSTYPVSKGAYAVRSGTSMSTPYMAGVIAVILEARGKLKPSAISILLTSTGQPVMFNDGMGNLNGMLAPVIQQGAGMVNAYKAATIQTMLSAYSIAFNDSMHFDPVQSFKLYNSGAKPVTYTFSNIPAAMAYTLIPATYYPMKFPPQMTNDAASLQFTPNTLVVLPNSFEVISVTARQPVGVDQSRLPVYSGYIKINGTNGDSIILPYAGVAGSLKNATLVDYLDGYPYLASSVDYTTPIANGSSPVFSLSKAPANNTSALPEIVWTLVMGSRIVRVDIIAHDALVQDAKFILGRKTLGSAIGYPLYNNPRDQIFNTTWSGQLDDGSFVKAGNYSFLLRALKIFGDSNNAVDYESYTTLPFTIIYNDIYSL